MKLKSLLLGSAAALALTSGALAADPRSSFVSLDVCDAYGISGLTIASSDTCLKISGSVSYEFQWGDYTNAIGGGAAPAGGVAPVAAAIPVWAGGVANRNVGNWRDGLNDWRTRLETILKFEASTQTDAGKAAATIVLRDRTYLDTHGNQQVLTGAGGTHTGADNHALRIEEAWVSFGDTTVLMAGKKGSIAKLDNDAPFNYLGLANASQVDTGVLWARGDQLRRGGHVIQVVSEVADGISVGAGLESLDGVAFVAGPPASGNSRGTFVGFVEANGAWGNAHATVVIGDVLDNAGGANPWGFHTGATFDFDNFKVRGALAVDDTGYWNALLSGEAAFDMFTLAASAEFINTAAAVNQMGLGASVGFQATETVKINAGFRYFDPNTAAAGGEGWQAALQVVAAVAEGIEASAAIGAYGNAALAPNDPLAYVDLGLTYKPGGGFETGVGLEANAQGAYKVKFNAKKSF